MTHLIKIEFSKKCNKRIITLSKTSNSSILFYDRPCFSSFKRFDTFFFFFFFFFFFKIFLKMQTSNFKKIHNMYRSQKTYLRRKSARIQKKGIQSPSTLRGFFFSLLWRTKLLLRTAGQVWLKHFRCLENYINSRF